MRNKDLAEQEYSMLVEEFNHHLDKIETMIDRMIQDSVRAEAEWEARFGKVPLATRVLSLIGRF